MPATRSSRFALRQLSEDWINLTLTLLFPEFCVSQECGDRAVIERMEEVHRLQTQLAFQVDADPISPQSLHENLLDIREALRQDSQAILDGDPDDLDAIITGVGTCGHITGVAEVLKPKLPSLQVFAVEPEKSPVISGGSPSPHRLQGIGAGFVPANLHTDGLNGVVQVTEEEAFTFARRAAAEEGLFIGISSGVSLAAVSKKLADFPDGATILTFYYDTGERYLSIDDLFPAQ